MKSFFLLTSSGGFAAILQLVANSIIFYIVDGNEYAHLTQVLLLSVTLRPLLTMKLENSLFRIHNFRSIGFFLVLLSLSVGTTVFIFGLIIGSLDLLLASCFCLLAALNEIIEITLIRLNRLNLLACLRLLRPSCLIILSLAVSITSLNMSVFLMLSLSYCPLLAVLPSLTTAIGAFRCLNLDELIVFFKNEKALALYALPAGVVYGLCQLSIFNYILLNSSVEVAATIGFSLKVLDSFLNVLIPNLRFYLLKFVKPNVLLLRFVLFSVFPFVLLFVLLLWYSNDSLLIFYFGMALMVLSRITITFFGAFAYSKRKDYVPLIDALSCWCSTYFLMFIAVSLEFLFFGYLGTHLICMIFLYLWESDFNED